MVGSLVMGCVVGNLVLFPAVKNFENLLSIDEVIAVSLVYYFFWETVYVCKIAAERLWDHVIEFWTKLVKIYTTGTKCNNSGHQCGRIYCSAVRQVAAPCNGLILLSFFLSFSFGVAHTPFACRR